jgi:hypothetical protein
MARRYKPRPSEAAGLGMPGSRVMPHASTSSAEVLRVRRMRSPPLGGATSADLVLWWQLHRTESRLARAGGTFKQTVENRHLRSECNGDDTAPMYVTGSRKFGQQSTSGRGKPRYF